MSNKKPKLLWIGDIIATTGFARVTENILERICDDWEVVVLGNNYWGDPHPLQTKYKIYPSSNRFQTAPFGEQRIREVVERERPDIVFTMNDIWIINEQYRQIADLHKQNLFKFIGYYPMDSYGWTGCIADTANEWDEVICYTDFGLEESKQGGITNKNIHSIPHGINMGQFYPMDKKTCREKLNLPFNDAFIVFNGNRNQFRKRIDLTITTFAKFCVDKPDTQLYLHMGLKDQGWDIMPLFSREMRKYGVDPNNRIILTSNSPGSPGVPVELLNVIYNACDVGINTCKGEGHGLVNHEHAACRVAQVVPDHTSCKEIFEGAAPLIECYSTDVDVNYSRELPIPDVDNGVEILNKLYYDRDHLNEVAEKCYDRATSERYDWDYIAPKFNKVFKNAIKKPGINFVSSNKNNAVKIKKSKDKKIKT
jgi:glycosyltransferase involved in cell wall biosynthesis